MQTILEKGTQKITVKKPVPMAVATGLTTETQQTTTKQAHTNYITNNN